MTLSLGAGYGESILGAEHRLIPVPRSGALSAPVSGLQAVQRPENHAPPNAARPKLLILFILFRRPAAVGIMEL